VSVNWNRTILMIPLMWLPLSTANGDDWPNWRGPLKNGVSGEKSWQQTWPANGPSVLWKANVGIGFSSVTVAKGRLYTMGNADNQDSVICLDTKSGNVLWKHSYDCPLEDRFFEGGPTSTPTVDGDRVYTLSRQGDVFCFDALSGQVFWSKNVQKDTEARIPGWGFSSSPLVHGNKLILNVGDAGIAIDKVSGVILWKSGAGEAGYMTPYPIKIGDRWFALIASGKFYQCVDLESGLVAWKHRWLTTNGCNAADPIVIGDQVFISSGYGRGAALLSFSDSAGKVVWSNTEMQNQLNSSVYVDGHLYGFDGDEGGEVQLKCMEFLSGEVRWSHAGLGAGSLMVADNHLIILSEAGELSIAPVSSKEFETTSSAKILDGKCWTVPVLSNGLIYCRNAAGELACVNVSS
jgi:outer membrane protein assembly factor BamB